MLRLLSIIFVSYSFSFSAFALPINKDLKSVILPESFGVNYDFEGIVALSNCSGSLIQLEGAPDSDLGLILTNGHCFEGGFAKPGTFFYHKPSTRTFTLLNPQGSNLGKVTATEAVYATMTRTDMTIYKLKETYAEIKSKYAVRPFTLSSERAKESDPIEVISGYWRRGYSCGIEAFVNELREDKWTMTDSIRYSRPGCETIGGTSGSPVVRAGTKIVIGVNNTGNESGEKCTMNNPCEVDSSGSISYVKGYSYGQQTYWIYSCLNANREIDLAVPGCLLLH